jgi:transcriptional regulator of heat shock response
MLTEITLNVGIAAAMPSTGQILDRIELLELADRRVLMILVTRSRGAQSRGDGRRAAFQDELNSIRNYVNHQFRGWMLGTRAAS